MAGVVGKRRSVFRSFTDSLTQPEKKRICIQINKNYGILSNLLFGNYFPTTLDHSFVAGRSRSPGSPIRVLQKFLQKEQGLYRDFNVKYYDVVVALCHLLNAQISDENKEEAKRLEQKITYLDLVRYTQFTVVRARVIIRKIANLERPDDPKTIEDLMCENKFFPTEVLVAMTIFRKYVIDNKLDEEFDASWSKEQYNSIATPTEDQNKSYFKLISSTQTRLSEALQTYHEIRNFMSTKEETMGRIRASAESDPQMAEFECRRFKDKVQGLISAAENAKKEYEEAVKMMKTFEGYDQERVEAISNLLNTTETVDNTPKDHIPERLFINQKNHWCFDAGDELFAEGTKTREEVDKAEVKGVLFDENFMRQYEGVDIDEVPSIGRMNIEETIKTERKKTRAPAKAYNKKDKLDALIGPDVPSTSQFRPASPQPSTSQSSGTVDDVGFDDSSQSCSSSPSKFRSSRSYGDLSPRRPSLAVMMCRKTVNSNRHLLDLEQSSTSTSNDEMSAEASSQASSRHSSPRKGDKTRKNTNLRQKRTGNDGESDERGALATDQDEILRLTTPPAISASLATNPATASTASARGTPIPAPPTDLSTNPAQPTRLATGPNPRVRTSSQSSQDDRYTSSTHSRRSSTRPRKLDQMLENIQAQYHRPLKQSPHNSPTRTTKRKEKSGRRGRPKHKSSGNYANELQVEFEVEVPFDESVPGNPDQHASIQPKTEVSTGRTNDQNREDQNSIFYCTRPSAPSTSQIGFQPGLSEALSIQNKTRTPEDQNEPSEPRNPTREDQNISSSCTRTSEPLNDLFQAQNPSSCPNPKQNSTAGLILVKAEPVSDEETPARQENLDPESRQLAPTEVHNEVEGQICVLSTMKAEVDSRPEFTSRFKSKRRQRGEHHTQQSEDLDLTVAESDQPDFSADLSDQELQIDKGDRRSDPTDSTNPANFGLTRLPETSGTSNSEEQNRPVDNSSSQTATNIDVGIQSEPGNEPNEASASGLGSLEAQASQSETASQSFPTSQPRPTSQSSQNLSSGQSTAALSNAADRFFQRPSSPPPKSPPTKRRRRKKSPKPMVPPNFGSPNSQRNLAQSRQLTDNSNDIRKQHLNQEAQCQSERPPGAAQRLSEFQSPPLRQPPITMASSYQPQNQQIPGLEYGHRPSSGPNQPVFSQGQQSQGQNVPCGTFEEWYRAVGGQHQGENCQNIFQFFPPTVPPIEQRQKRAPGSIGIPPSSFLRFPHQPGPSAPSQPSQHARLAFQISGYGPTVGQRASNEPNRSRNQSGSSAHLQNQASTSTEQVQYHQRATSQAAGYGPKASQVPYHYTKRYQHPHGASGNSRDQVPTSYGQVQHHQGSSSQMSGYGVNVSQGTSNGPRNDLTQFRSPGGHQQRVGASTSYLQQHHGSANQMAGYDPRLGQSQSHAQNSSQPRFGASGGRQQQAPSSSHVQQHQTLPNQTEFGVPRTGQPQHRLLFSTTRRPIPMEIHRILSFFEYRLDMNNIMNPFDKRDLSRMIEELNNNRLFDDNGEQITSIEHLGAWIVKIRKKVVEWFKSTQ